ncbi:hypothetical protein JXZ92_01530 [Mycoplasma sp. CSL10137]|uniref:hypothetical protein n=1 Tax=unclassified Mycoplasma TaxID=2683645 RepID=UPI00197B5AA6|nr:MULTISPECIES: hypothetical protein [unclassified Mycoplasma]MBN4083501.1 hypothetical protein [Mycoplasma sp. CSL10137]MBN4084568.1 hypothetical protein [Mycoplasma sp. CSL10166]MBU4693046.1 hypothetical protein [Mycoplasma sp. CSL7491-lung]
MNFKKIKKVFFLNIGLVLPIASLSCSNQSIKNEDQEPKNFNDSKKHDDVIKVSKLLNIDLNSEENQLDWVEFKEQYSKIQFDESKSSEFLSKNWITFLANLNQFYSRPYPDNSENKGWYLFPNTNAGKHSQLYIHVIGVDPKETLLQSHKHISLPDFDTKLNSKLTQFSKESMFDSNERDSQAIFLTKRRTVIKISKSKGKIKVFYPSYTFLAKDINSNFVRSISISNEYINFLFNGNINSRTQSDFDKFENMTFEIGVPYKSFLILK